MPLDLHGVADDARLVEDPKQDPVKAQRWEEIPARISDEVQNLYATVGPYDEIVPKLRSRYAELVSNAEFSIPVRSPADLETLRQMVRDLRAE